MSPSQLVSVLRRNGAFYGLPLSMSQNRPPIIQRVSKAPDDFFKILTACPLGTASILIVIINSDVWGLDDMDNQSVQCISALELFIKTESVTPKQCGFQQQFQRSDAPSCNTLPLWVLKWCQKGSVKDSKPQGCPSSAHTMFSR
jgi:hypothetical protein